MIFNVKIIIDGYPLILTGMFFCQRRDIRLVSFCREMIWWKIADVKASICAKRKDYIIDNVKNIIIFVLIYYMFTKSITLVRKIFTSREKIQCNFNFNNWILFWWINESGIWEVAPILVSKVIDRTKRNNLLRLVTSFGTISLNWFSNTSFSVGGRICGLSHVKTINEMTNLWLFDNKGRQEPLNLILLAKSFFVVQCFGGNS